MSDQSIDSTNEYCYDDDFEDYVSDCEVLQKSQDDNLSERYGRITSQVKGGKSDITDDLALFGTKSYSLTSVDPQLQKMNKILNQRSFQVSQYINLLSYRPRSLYQKYLHKVQKNHPVFREIGTQHIKVNISVRTQTNSISKRSEGCQYINCDDDILWHKICKMCRLKRYSSISRLIITNARETYCVKKLSTFLKKSRYVIETILDETRYATSTSKHPRYSHEGEVKSRSDVLLDRCDDTLNHDKTLQLDLERLLKNRKITHIFYPNNDVSIIFAIFSPKYYHSEPDKYIDNKYVICVWQIYSLIFPVHILISDDPIHKNNVCLLKCGAIICGIEDGIIQLWDTRIKSQNQSIYWHPDSKYTSLNSTIKSVSYQTEMMTESTSILNLSIVPDGETKKWKASEVASFDTMGNLIFWSIEECHNTNNLANHVLNYWSKKLVPFRRLTVFQTFSFSSNFGKNDAKDLIMTQEFKAQISRIGVHGSILSFFPSKKDNFLIPMHDGKIISFSTSKSSNLVSVQKTYYLSRIQEDPDLFTSVNVNAIEFSPFDEHLFLVGWSDGTISLFHTDISDSCMLWQLSEFDDGMDFSPPNKQEYFVMSWSHLYPTVFFVQAKEKLYTFDLIKDDIIPSIKKLGDITGTCNNSSCYSLLWPGRAHEQSPKILCFDQLHYTIDMIDIDIPRAPLRYFNHQMKEDLKQLKQRMKLKIRG